jgi:hypothetical protein
VVVTHSDTVSASCIERRAYPREIRLHRHSRDTTYDFCAHFSKAKLKLRFGHGI